MRFSASFRLHSLRVILSPFLFVVVAQPEVLNDQFELHVDVHQLPDDAIDRHAVEDRLRSPPHGGIVAGCRSRRKMAWPD